MAAVDENVNGNTPSTVFTPTVKVSDVVIEAVPIGQVLLQCKTPTSSKWTTIAIQSGAFSVVTSDPAVTYRFLPVDATTNVRVYMGP